HQVGEQIDDLALAFVTPLGAQHNYVFSHVNRSKDRSDNRFEGDNAVLDHQHTVAAQFREIGFAVVKATHHPLPGGAQVADGLAPRLRLGRRRVAATAGFLAPSDVLDLGLEGDAEAGGGPRPAKGFADIVVATAVGEGLAGAGAVGGKDDASVVVIALQLAQIEIDPHPGAGGLNHIDHLLQLVDGELHLGG